MTTLAEAAAQMSAAGMPDFPPGHPGVTGHIVRYGPNKNAWYVLHEFITRSGKARIAGSYGYWGKIDSAKIEMDWRDIDAAEREELQRSQREQQAREREHRATLATSAANRARKQWEQAHRIGAAPAAWALATYLDRKSITPESVRVTDDGTLLVPLILFDDGDGGRMVGVQKITPDGQKRFNKNMAKEGTVCRLGPVPTGEGTVLLCEGYSTGRSIRQALPDYTVFVCVDSGNLLPAARILRARYPAMPMIFCADDDWKTEIPKGTPFNVGVIKARAAADAVGNASIVVPLFPVANARRDGWTDFNDLAAVAGIEAVRDQITGALLALAIERADHLNASAELPEKVGVAGAERESGPPDGPPDEPPPWHGDGGGGGRDDNPPGWVASLQRTEKGSIKPTLHNAFSFLANDPAWAGVIAWDLFAECVVKLKPPPFEGGAVGEWTDLDDHRTLLWLSKRMGEPGGDAVVKAVVLAAHRCEFNAVKNYIEATPWDGTMRLKTWLIDWCQVKKSEKFTDASPAEQDRLMQYLEMVAVKWMVAAIARVYQPGCRVDYMLILEGEGGLLKSTIFRYLGGEWFSDARLNFQDKDSLLILQGRWIIELPELDGMNRSDTSETKRFITQHIDLFRPPYGRRLIKAPRRCVLGGTVNHATYLKDETGNRRFWPVLVGGVVDVEAFAQVVPQLWAEALVMYRAGVKYWAEPHEKHLFEEQQEERFQQHPWESDIHDYLDGLGDWSLEGGRLNTTSVPQIMTKCLKLEIARRTPLAQRDIGGIMTRLGWRRKKLPKLPGDSGPARQWQYVRPDGVLVVPVKDDSTPPPPNDDDGGLNVEF